MPLYDQLTDQMNVDEQAQTGLDNMETTKNHELPEIEHFEEEDDDDSEEQDQINETDLANENDLGKQGVNSESVTSTTNDLQIPYLKKLNKPVPDYPIVEESYYTWKIESWSSIKVDRIRSPTFKCGEYMWNVLLFPKGNNNNQLSIYIEPHPIDQSKGDDWYVCAQFGLHVWNPYHPEAHLSSVSYHRFNKNETDWGFSSFIDVKNLQSPNFLRSQSPHAILENNVLNISALIRVIDDSSTGVLWHNFIDYDSKNSTGFVGLSNQGATCYLNSLLQSYFSTKYFRKLVYQIPSAKFEPGSSVPLSLQRIFYQLKTSNEAVGTLELTKSFGWDSSDAFTQHDVQELNRILMDKLESAMKGSPIEGSLNDVFVGKMKSYIKCVNVPYESSRVEDFWDIQLNVKGFKGLEESFKNYIEVEMLEGENKYQAGDEYGYQDAKKGVVFEYFPPVLHLQLKRFEYDFMIDDLVKIDDKYEFPDSIDLSPFLDDEIPLEIKQENWNYKLHGVLVHQGSISNGHYYALIKPDAKDAWLRFDDDKVWKCTPSQVFYENFGAAELDSESLVKLTKAEQNEYFIRRSTSAYMLVYFREAQLSKILPEDDSSIDNAIPDHVPRRLKAELDEKIQIEKARQEALYNINVKLVTRKNFNSYDAFDLYPDITNEKFYDSSLYDVNSFPLTLQVKRDDSFMNFFILVGIKLGYLPENYVLKDFEDIKNLPYRLVAMNHRNNRTNRSDTPVPFENFESTVSDIFFECFNRKHDEMAFFVEDTKDELNNVVNHTKRSSTELSNFKFDQAFTRIDSNSTRYEFPTISEFSPEIMIFIKYFDSLSCQLRGLTFVYAKKDQLINELIDPLNNLLGFDSNHKFTFYEELSPSKLEALQMDTTFERNELGNGDIICIESMEPAPSEVKFESIKSYYTFIFTRIHIIVSPFRPNPETEDVEFIEDAENGPIDDDKELLENSETVNESTRNHRQVDTWISSQLSYIEFATEIAKELPGNIDPEYLRIFAVNNDKLKFPLKRNINISQIFNHSVPALQISNFEYEILSIPLKDYENMKLILFKWLTNLIHYQTFEFLVPKLSLVGEDLMSKLLHKIHIPQDQVENILIWSGINHKYVDLIRFDKEINSIPENFEIYGGVFPAEVETLVNFDMIKRYHGEIFNTDNVSTLNPELVEVQEYELQQVRKCNKKLNMIPGFHFHKNSIYHHGVPFIFPVFVNETFDETKNRLRAKLGLGIKEFEKIKFALADVNDKGKYLDLVKDSGFILYDELKKHKEQLSLALDHPDRSPRRQNPYERGISIK